MVPMGMVIPPSLYEGNHGNDHLSSFPGIDPLPLGSVPHAYCWWDPILRLETFHTLLGLNQTFKPTHFPKRFQRKINKFKMKAKRV